VPDNEFQFEAIGAVYAQALINEAQKQNALAEITEDVRGIGELLRTNDTFRAFVQALAIGEDERLASLEKIFAGRVHVLTLNILKALSRRDRFVLLQAFVEAFDGILKKMSGVVEVQLAAAVILQPDAIQRVQDALARSLGKAIDLRVTIDPALVGGITLTIGDTLIDGSVATQLRKLQAQLRTTANFDLEKVVSPW
jgi:F-type H+-transporting ATPase subunit delta